MALIDLIPGMTDADLKTLRANAERLVDHGAPAQKSAAAEILPVIAAEFDARAERAPTKAAAKKPAKPRVKKAEAEAA